MKKLCISLLILMANAAPAQKLMLGLEGGAAWPTLRSHYSGEDRTIKNIKSFMAGFALQYDFTKHIALRTGLGYEQKGGLIDDRFKITDAYGNLVSNVTYKYDLRYNYLVLPALFRYTLGNKVKVFANAGPYLGFLYTDRITLTIHSTTVNYNFPTTAVYTHYNRLNVGATAGIGIAMPIEPGFSISIEARYNQGLNSIYQSSSNYVVSSMLRSDGTYISSVNLLLGIVYRLDAF